MKRDYNLLLEYAEKQLRRGKISLFEYREVEYIAFVVFNAREATTTISKTAAEICKLYGVHVQPSGIGYKLILLPFNNTSRKQWYNLA